MNVSHLTHIHQCILEITSAHGKLVNKFEWLFTNDFQINNNSHPWNCKSLQNVLIYLVFQFSPWFQARMAVWLTELASCLFTALYGIKIGHTSSNVCKAVLMAGFDCHAAKTRWTGQWKFYSIRGFKQYYTITTIYYHMSAGVCKKSFSSQIWIRYLFFSS